MTKEFFKKNKWIKYTIFFMIFILILFTIILWNPFIGTFITILLLLSLLVGNILESFYETKKDKKSDNIVGDNYYIKELSEEQTINSQKLLRFATAALAFLSLLTTASGMNSYVFDTSWKAYIASFAVQSILVVFSLLLCRFFVQITVLQWHKYIKIIANTFMIIFFCVALIVSSTFSFTYIANNAYKDTWANDREIMIQSYLMNVTYQLRDENNYRGDKIINEIEAVSNDSLRVAFEAKISQDEVQLVNQIKNEINKLHFNEQEKGKVSIDIDQWHASYPQYRNQIDILYSDYQKNFENKFEEIVDKYNDILGQIEIWQKEDPNYLTIAQEIDKIFREIERAKKSLKILGNINDESESQAGLQGIDGWKTYMVNEDASIQRNHYKTECNLLLGEFEILEDDLESLNNIVNSFVSLNIGGNTNELDDILKNIYLISADNSDDLDKLIKEINDLVIGISGTDFTSSEEAKKIIDLKDNLLEYKKYLFLKEKLDIYCNENIGKTYQIKINDNALEPYELSNNYDESEKNILDKIVNNEEEDVFNISEQEWIDIRINDFNLFYSYVKMLPYVEEKEDGNNNESNLEKFIADEIIKETSIYQRDLLGQITNFEKAFIYFKYDFSMMAFFSAFIAVFFDLGAFFTGCFLYATEYFNVRS